MTSADIVRELQAAAPVASDALRLRIAELEARPKPASPRLFGGRARRRFALLALPAAAALAVVAGAVTGALDDPSATRDLARPPQTNEASSMADGVTAGGSAADSATTYKQGAATPPTAGARLESSARLERYAAQLTLEVPDSDAVSKTTQAAIAAVRDLGGYVVSAQVATGGVAQASLTLRVPHEQAEEAFVRLQGLGKIVQQNVQIDDLQETADAHDRTIARLRTQLATVLGRLAGTELDTVERSQLEARRDLLKGQLDATRRARSATGREASVASISLELRTPEGSQVVPPVGRFDRSLDRVVDILALEAVALATAAAVLLPFALVGAALWLGRRGLRRRVEHDLLEA